MSRIAFLVQGSAEEPYEVVFEKDGQVLTCSCTCTAARNNLMCKHRLGILKKKPKGIASDNLDELDTVYAWVDASHVRSALTELDTREKDLKELEKSYRQAKDSVNLIKSELVDLLKGELPSWAQEREPSDIS